MSVTAQRKERQRAEREKMILDVSRRLLLEHGFSGVVYEHFKSKEDLIFALAGESMERKAAWFARAAAFQGRHRERMMAIGVSEELFVRLNPQYFHTEQIIHMSLMAERASDERCEELLTKQRSCFASVLSIVNDAVAAGDFKIPANMAAPLWGLLNQAYGPRCPRCRRRNSSLFQRRAFMPLHARRHGLASANHGMGLRGSLSSHLA